MRSRKSGGCGTRLWAGIILSRLQAARRPGAALCVRAAGPVGRLGGEAAVPAASPDCEQHALPGAGRTGRVCEPDFSFALSAMKRRLSSDWRAAYGHPPAFWTQSRNSFVPRGGCAEKRALSSISCPALRWPSRFG